MKPGPHWWDGIALNHYAIPDPEIIVTKEGKKERRMKGNQGKMEIFFSPLT